MRWYILLLGILLCSPMAHAALKYQQELTISSWKSMDEVEKQALEFCAAALGDPDIEVIDVRYEEKGKRKDKYYSAILTCHVSQVDQDLMRIQGKVFQMRNRLQQEEKAPTPE